MRRRRLDPTRWLVGFLIFALCMIGVLTNSGHDAGTLPRAQFDDGTPLGGKGLRLMLQKLGYGVAKQTDPLQKMPANAKIWLILDPETGFSQKESSLLLAWVKKGGILLYCVRPQNNSWQDDDPENEGVGALRKALGISRSDRGDTKSSDFLPELAGLRLDAVAVYRTRVKKASGSTRSTEISRPHLQICGPPSGTLLRIDEQKGHIFVLPDALLLTNYALSKDDNAVLVSNLLRVHAVGGTVYFDERKHGDDARHSQTAPPTLMSYLRKPPVSYAVWQFLVAGLLFWAFAGRRLGAPVSLPSSGPVTRASQFAAAMGALFSKTNRPHAATAIIGQRFRRRLAQRLGMSSAESDAVLARRAQEVAAIPFDVTDRLLLHSQAPSDSLSQALRDAQEMEIVLRQLEGKSKT